MLNKTLANAALFQVGWFACVLGGHSAWLLLAGAALVIQVLWIKADIRLVLLVCVLGSVIDSVLLNVGVFAFDSPGKIIPFWLMLLWALLATTLNHCLAWTAKPLWLCAVLGAVAGPLSYYAGQRLDAVAFPLGLWPTLIGLGVVWGALFPTLQWLAGKFSHPAV